MRMIFAGRENNFNRKLFFELSIDNELLCCLFLEPERSSFSNQFKRIFKRIKKYGFIRVIDELSFHLADRILIRRIEKRFKYSRHEYFVNRTVLNCPTFKIKNINDEKWLDLIKSFSPDIIVSACSNVIFKPPFFNIPKYGTFVLHEGITPEYRGLHTTLWALLKKEYNYIGYTVLKVNESIDGGDILLQENYKLKNDESFRTWGWISHIALIEGLDSIKKAFKTLELNKGFTPIDVQNRKSDTYTWMTFSKFLYLLYCS
jgi:hypothetical protein